MLKKPLIPVLCCAALTASAAEPSPSRARSTGVYRLPYADGVSVKVFDDLETHRPRGRIDFFAVDGPRPYKVLAAARGRIAAIQDGYEEKQSGRAAADCRNNYVWIEHANGEWTNYSHLARDSVTKLAKLKVGDRVEAGNFHGVIFHGVPTNFNPNNTAYAFGGEKIFQASTDTAPSPARDTYASNFDWCKHCFKADIRMMYQAHTNNPEGARGIKDNNPSLIEPIVTEPIPRPETVR